MRSPLECVPHGVPGGDNATTRQKAARYLAHLTAQLLNPRHKELVHDGSERFLVDGEGLLYESLYGTGCAGRLSPGQPLQVLYWAEALLQTLLTRGGRFVVTFSRTFDADWALDPAVAACRSLMQRHLSALPISGGALEVVTLDNYLHHWDVLVSELRPQFVMVSDAAVLKASKAAASSNAASNCGEPATPAAAARQRLLAALWRSLLCRVDVAFLGQLDTESHLVSGFVQSYAVLHHAVASKYDAIAGAVAALLLPPDDSSGVSAAAATRQLEQAAAALQAALGQQKEQAAAPPSWRLAAAQAALASLSEVGRVRGSAVTLGEQGSPKVSAWLGSLWLLHAALLEAAPLEDRALPGLAALAAAAASAEAGKAVWHLAQGLIAPFEATVMRCATPVAQAAHNAAAGSIAEAAAAALPTMDGTGPTANSAGTNGAQAEASIAPMLPPGLADLFDTHVFECLVLLALAEPADSTAHWDHLLRVLTPPLRARLASAVAAAELGGTPAAGAPTALPSCLQAPQSALQAWGRHAGVALQEAARLRSQHRERQEGMMRDAEEQQWWLQSLESSNGLIPAMRAALGASTNNATPDAAAAGGSEPDNGAAGPGGSSNDTIGELHRHPLAAPHFGVRPWVDAYHWHAPQHLKPWFLLESKTESQDLEAQKKVLASMPPERLLSRQFRRHIAPENQMTLQRLLHQAREEADPVQKQHFMNTAAAISQQALAAWMSRQKQFAARAMARMVNSLSGQTFHSTHRSRMDPLALLAAAAPASAPAARGGSGGKAKGSGKAAAMKEANALRLAGQKAAQEQARWQASALKVVRAALQEVHALELARVCEAVDAFVLSCQTPSVVAQALCAKVIVIHAWLAAATKAPAAAAPPSKHGAGAGAAGQREAAVLPAEVTAPARAMMLVLVQVAQLPDNVQAAPVPLPAPGSAPVSPLEAAAALAAAARYRGLSSALLGRLKALEAAGSAPAGGVSGKGKANKLPKRLELAKVRLKAQGTGDVPSAERVQLALLPDLLPREALSTSDPRVSFVPDAWQRRLLDAVDAGASGLVCAPTSSGKTFISSYVIEKVLQEGPKGVVVIVLPTKALVNQVYADFGARDANVHGVFTKDFRYNELTCRVLITVPACLEILLLSPANRAWSDSIRAAIFDEVHCINESGAGDTWERLLLLTRCPILALSATVGNPEELAEWLQRIKSLQREQDRAAQCERKPATYRVDLILHSERHNDLLHSTFLPDVMQPTAPAAAGKAPGEGDELLEEEELAEGDRELQQSWEPAPMWKTHAGGSGRRPAAAGAAYTGGRLQGALLAVHPAACVSLEGLAASGWPAALSLAPDEALQLYDAMHAALGAALCTPEEAELQGQGQQEEDGAAGDARAWLASAQDALAALAPEALTAAPPLIPAAAFGAPATSAGQEAPPQHALARLLVTRQRAKAWTAQLVALLAAWASGPEPALAAAALARLRDGVAAADGSHEAAWDAAQPLHPVRGMAYQLAGLMQLLTTLHARALLPCIVFIFDRGLCEVYAKEACSALVQAERHFRARYTTQLAACRREAAAATAAQEAAAARAEAAAHRKAGSGRRQQQERDEGGAAAVSAEAAAEAGAAATTTFTVDGIVFSADEDLPDPSFTFLPIDKARGEQAVEELRHSGCEEALVALLRRGVAVHHSGLDKRYRQAVETLFRSKHLAVVVATGTLAYGIHMPCRAVVMAGDSVFLDALNFSQMSGRAGRRGLDSVGHVVHYALPLAKICALRVAKLPRLRGHFLLSPTLVLRAILLAHQLGATPAGSGGSSSSSSSVTAAGARAALMVLVLEPLLGVTNEALAAQLRLAVDFAAAYLRSANLVDGTCRPVGLAGLATHLFWTAPAQMILVRFLATGVFHEVLAGCPMADRSATLLLLLAHLFERKPLHPLAVAHWRRQASASPSEVVLPELPPVAQEVLADHNAAAQQLLLATLTAHAARRHPHTIHQDATLPLSQLAFSTRKASGATDSSPLARLALPSLVASPFMALCGRGDAYASLAELLGCLPASLQVPASCLPILSTTDARGGPLQLNAYMVDYLRHRQKRALVRDNGLREGDAWQLLHSATGIVAATAHALQECADADSGWGGMPVAGTAAGAAAGSRVSVSSKEVVAAFEGLRAEFADAFYVFNGPRQLRRQ